MSKDAAPSPTEPDTKGRRPQARLALALLEALRDMDRPGEILDDEDVSLTLPRRFGLSGVVEAQIRRYEREARHGRRIPAAEVEDLIRLATRRTDVKSFFLHVGRSLTAANGAPAWRAALPERLALHLARQRIRRRLRALFGREMVAPARGRLGLEAVTNLLVATDPGGGACELVTGLSQAVVETYVPGGGTMSHASCRTRSEERCVWSLEAGPPSSRKSGEEEVKIDGH